MRPAEIETLQKLRRQHRSTGLPLGPQPARYMDRDGFESCAEWIKERLLASNGPKAIELRADTGVRIVDRNKMTADEFDAMVLRAGYIGTYNRLVMCEQIEDDLIHWSRQVTA